MSPVRACGRCGRSKSYCRCSTRRAPRRAYSDTAAYREMLAAVLETHGEDCHYCATPTDAGARELAHLIAHSAGGPFELDNLRVSCAPRADGLYCNRAAGARTEGIPNG